MINWIWKAYLLSTLVVSGFIYWPYLQALPSWSIRDTSDMILLSLSLLALYLYVNKKTLWNQRFWKYLFWFSMLDIVLSRLHTTSLVNSESFFFYLYQSAVNPVKPGESVLICLCLLIFLFPFIPAYYALYRLGQPKLNR
jgi:hypothetical protein